MPPIAHRLESIVKSPECEKPKGFKQEGKEFWRKLRAETELVRGYAETQPKIAESKFTFTSKQKELCTTLSFNSAQSR